MSEYDGLYVKVYTARFRFTFLKMLCKLKSCKSNTEFPFKTMYFLVVKGLTISS